MPSVVTALDSYVRTHDRLGIDVDVPPVLAYLENSSGQRVGADFSKPVTAWGIGSEVREIPQSKVVQENISADDVDDRLTRSTPQPTTTWGLIIYDGGDQSYILVAKGVALGVGEFGVDSVGTLADPKPELQTTFSMLAAPGVIRRFLVKVDRAHASLSVRRQVSVGQLREDIDLSCRLGFVLPAGICESLGAKARAAENAAKRRNVKAELGSLRALLHELGADDGMHVKEPGATVLKEEVTVLLESLGAASVPVAAEEARGL